MELIAFITAAVTLAYAGGVSYRASRLERKQLELIARVRRLESPLPGNREYS